MLSLSRHVFIFQDDPDRVCSFLPSKFVVQIHMRLINPCHGQIWVQAFYLFTEMLLHSDDQPALFHVNSNCTIVLTDTCKNSVLMHLKTANVQLTTYPWALAWFQLDEGRQKSFQSLVSLPLILV
jgi:hypothetical protein